MILEKWHVWQPLKKMTGKYYIKSFINDNLCGLMLILSEYDAPVETEVRLYIDGIEAYRVTNETYKLKLWEYLSATHKDLNRKWPLFTVEGSTFLNSLSEESEGISDHRKLKHYCIMDTEWVLDIATPSAPIVTFFVNGKTVESSE